MFNCWFRDLMVISRYPVSDTTQVFWYRCCAGKYETWVKWEGK